MNPRPTVLFVCVSNAGKSQMAEAVARQLAGDALDVHSAGTKPKSSVNPESAASVAAVGASMDSAVCKGIVPEVLRRADRVIVLGRDAAVAPVDGMKAVIERWETDEPSERGITGADRMNLIRDDIRGRVVALLGELGIRPSN